MKQKQEERDNTNNKFMETKICAQQRSLAFSETKYKKLEEQYDILRQVREDLEVELEEEQGRIQEVCHIAHSKQRWHGCLHVCPQQFFSNTKPILSYHNLLFLTLNLSLSITIKGENIERRICPA